MKSGKRMAGRGSDAEPPPIIQQALKFSGVGLLRISAGGRILGMDAGTIAMLDLNGKDTKNLHDKKLADLFGDEASGSDILKRLKNCAHGATFESCARTRGGRTRWLQITCCHVQPSENGRRGPRQLALIDITNRKEAEERQQHLAAGLRTVVQIADSLMGYSDEDAFFRFAVEAARQRLPLERCAIYVCEGPHFRGTYGIDRKGRIMSEDFHRFLMPEEWLRRLRSIDPEGVRMMTCEGSHYEVRNRRMVKCGRGWFAITPILSAHQLLGIFLNDNAMSGNPMDPVKQELVSVLCSLLGDILDRMKTESRRQAVSDGLRAVTQVADELIACPDLDTLCRRGVELARERLNIERCAVFLRDGKLLRGTFGTNLRRETTDEKMQAFSAYSHWLARIEKLPADNRKVVMKNEPYTEWNGSEFVRFDKGWVAITPIQSSGEVIGVFSNDTAITRKPMDEAQQEVISVFCSTLGAMIERRRAESALIESERRFRETLSNVALTAVTLDMNGRITFCNDYLLNITGWKSKELIGQCWFDHMIPKPDRKSLRAMFLEMAPVGRFPMHYENDIVTRSGKRRTVSWNNTPLRGPDGGIIGVTSIGEDITERQRAIEEIRRLAMVVEQQAEAVVIADITGAIQYVNPAFERLTGFTAAEVIGHNPRVLTSGRQSRENYAAMLRQVTAGIPWSGHFTNRRKDGGHYEVDTTISPIRDDKGTMVGFVSTSRDVTHEVQLEQQFRQSQKMEAIGRLAGGIAHDFNNLLTSILGYGRLIQDELPADSPIAKDIEEVINAGERAAALTRQLLTFSRKQAVQTHPIKLNGVVMDMDRLLRRTLGEDVELVTILDNEMSYANADVGLLEQIIMNLAINARDAMPQGGTLTIHTSTVDLNDQFCASHAGIKSGRYVLLSVRDSGVGMSRDVYERCFEPFFTTKEQGKGTGLGLSIVYSIVQQLNGFVTVDSAPNRGTAFTIYFPAVPPPAFKVEAYERVEMPRGNETILVVEDEEAVRRLTVRLLETLGYKVLQARHGGEALLICERHEGRIDLVLTDVVMPHIGGQELVQRLLKIRKEFGVLYMSGFTDTAFVCNSADSEKAPLILKPFTNEALAVRIRAVLDDTLPAARTPDPHGVPLDEK